MFKLEHHVFVGFLLDNREVLVIYPNFVNYYHFGRLRRSQNRALIPEGPLAVMVLPAGCWKGPSAKVLYAQTGRIP